MLLTCFNGRTAVLAWRSTGDAETTAAAIRAMRSMVYEEAKNK
jgi:hypothetical protein